MSEFFEKTHDQTFTAAQNFLKTTAVINGGAAVAILAFIGSLIGRAGHSGTDLKSISHTLLWFVAGVVASSLAMAASYFATLFILPLTVSAISGQPTKRIWRILTFTFGFLTTFLGIFSIILFVVGVLEAQYAIETLGP